MEGGEDWLLQPIDAGMLPFSALNDTGYHLADWVLCLEYMDVKAENSHRHKTAVRKQRD
jgi:hypothetical protein